MDTANFQKKLLCWYNAHKRSLPWRDIQNPYYIWVSEIMLQQTQVNTVIPYFDRFIKQYPGVEELAVADEEELLKLWEGLGYYNRVKNMKEAAKQILEIYQGEFPRDAKALRNLKGIGDYTAGAIASIAFEKREPAVDGNVLRVMARISSYTGDIKASKAKKEFTENVRKLLPAKNIGDFNQALIELGALVCLPGSNPQCFKCPISDFCKAYNKGLQNQIPKRMSKMEKHVEYKTVLVLQCGKHFFIRRRPGEKLLGGLWEFPTLEGHRTQKEIRHILEKDLADTLPTEGKAASVCDIFPMDKSRAVFTHKKWDLMGYWVLLDETKSLENRPNIAKRLGSEGRWATKKEICDKYSIASAYKIYRNMVSRKN